MTMLEIWANAISYYFVGHEQKKVENPWLNPGVSKLFCPRAT